MLSKSIRVASDTPLDSIVPSVVAPQALPVVTQGPSAAAEITYLNGLNPDGSISANSYWGFHNTTAFKFGPSTAGTGATVSFAFNTFSNFTTAEQNTFRAAFAEWASVANLTFVESSNLGTADILLIRGSDGGAYTDSANTNGLGSALGHPDGQTVISIDSSVYGFELDGSYTASGGYGLGTIMHEIGHALGLGHAGAYDGDVDPATQQYSAFDDVLWTTMSYLNWRDSHAKYRDAYPVIGTDWGQFQGPGFSDYRDVPHTVMQLDILAIQQLYGAPVNSIMSGGQIYGFNTNITGPIRHLFDFTDNKAPILTLFNTGTGNTLDLSGFGGDSVISLVAGTFSSVAGLRNNIYIAEGTRIDTLIATSGNETITANDNGDTIYGGNGSDRITGGLGNDKIYGGTDGAFDIITGGGGKDRIEGNGHFSGGDGDDYLFGTGDFEGGAGNDQLIGGIGNVFSQGGDGDDVLVAASLFGNLNGGAGDDVLIGAGGNDIFHGDAGFDTFRGGGGNDTFYLDSQSELVFEDAGGGTDTIYVSASFYLFANVENLVLQPGAAFGVGNELNNAITGNAAANTLLGGAGNDSIFTGGGGDIVYGEGGDDTLGGSDGLDFMVGGDGNDVINGGHSADALYGGDGDDVLSGDIPRHMANTDGASVSFSDPDFSTDILVGGNGNDILHGETTLGDYDLMDGGAGNDIYYVDTPNDLTFEAADGGTDTVIAKINGAGYYLYANVENLILADNTPFGVGNELDNALTGNAIGNYLLGGAGNDTINGKAGSDVLFGEAGADIFVFEHGTGGDVIGDFVAGTDRIDLTAIGYSWQQVQNSLHENGGNTAIDLGNGDIVILNGVTVAQLSQSDFILAISGSAPEPLAAAATAPSPISASFDTGRADVHAMIAAAELPWLQPHWESLIPTIMPGL